MKRKLWLVTSFLFFLSCEKFYGQSFPVKIMCWNLLNYPDATNIAADTALRHPFYRAVVQYTVPDILVTEENTLSSSPVWFLDDVMNAGGVVYNKGTFINGSDTDNEIYFRDSLFSFVSNTRIRTDLRDINEFKLVHLATGDTIRIYAVHLKASSGSTNESQRALEVDSLRKITNQLPAGSNFIVCGDFNFYGDYENGYQQLLLNNPNDDGNFIDPIVMTGVWHNAAYTNYHTQSTRTASFGGGATGGMNDRFDLMLFSTAISQGSSGIQYVSGSTTAVGNDGNHYNEAINVIHNTAAPTAVVNALYNASDHLPVYAMFNFSVPNGIFSPNQYASDFSLFPNPCNPACGLKYHLDYPAKISIMIFNSIGKEVLTLQDEQQKKGDFEMNLNSINSLSNGLYFIYFQHDTYYKSIRFIICN